MIYRTKPKRVYEPPQLLGEAQLTELGSKIWALLIKDPTVPKGLLIRHQYVPLSER